jgi:hypothetical protein
MKNLTQTVQMIRIAFTKSHMDYIESQSYWIELNWIELNW